MPRNLPAESVWKPVSKSGRFEWHDHRAHWMGKGEPPQLKDKDVETKLYDWEVPVLVGDQKGTIAGTLMRVPLDESSIPIGAIVGFAALVIALSLAVLFVRRRRTSAGEKVAEAW